MKDSPGAMELAGAVMKIHTHQRPPILRSTFKGLLLLSVILISISYLSVYKDHLSDYLQSNTSLKQTNPIYRAPLPLEHPNRSFLQHHLAFPRNYHFILDDTDVCRSNTPFLVLVVPVAPSNRKARDAIRKTWGTETLVQGELIQTVFLLGLPSRGNITEQQEHVSMENLQYHDLIQSDFIDSYNNLTIKTMVIMDWLATQCPKVSYAMKIDSDMFLNVENLVSMLKSPGIPKELYLTGMLMWNRPVIRDRSSKWYVPKEMYPDPHYPTYTLGMGYLFSIDLTSTFVEVSKSIEPFNIEDAYIGMCMKKLGLSPTQPPHPDQFRAYLGKYNRCTFSKIITYILGSPQQLVTFWTDLKKPGPPC
ncbi:beta-1,3-galactosyltransferase 2-like [Gadus morhua]|uniref:Hexosyltransferase n=1 Tax=Gadus morhua TaxID=8049 RepID=A0A8C5FKR4_GADMO|nr:beta-1,3-galactosyltransferase 2-like [Gadus morhua]